MSGQWLPRLLVLPLALSVGAREAAAQGSEFAKAVLALPSIPTPAGDARTFDSPLFEGTVEAVISNVSGSNSDFEASDVISFRAVGHIPLPTSPTGEGFSVPFVGTRTEFEAWARKHAKELLDVFFPSGLAAALSGRDTSTIYSQQLVLTTILDTAVGEERRRRPSAALFDTEWINFNQGAATATNDSAWAMQGLYSFTPTLSVQGRYGNLSRTLSTSTTSLAVDYHPFIERGDTVIVRAGGMGRAGFLYSSTAPSPSAIEPLDPLRMGIFDFSGGGWASVLRGFGPVLLGGGALFQVTKHQALEGSEDDFRKAFALAINDRGLEYDTTLGATARTDVSKSISVVTSYAGTFALESVIDRPAAHSFLGAMMYSLGPGAALNVGYKTTGLTGGRAHSIFFQGNFGW